jgi:hypothetical protein
MIGSISKVRPCAHSHYYKYCSARNPSDLARVDRNYKKDLQNGKFDFDLSNLTSMSDFFNGSKDILEFKQNTGKITNIYRAFNGCTNIKEIELKNTALIGQCSQSFYYCHNVEKIKINDEYGMGKVTLLHYFAERCWKLKEFTGQYFENCTSGNNVFGECTSLTKFDCGLPALQQTNNAMSFFYGCPLTEIKFPIDEDGVCIYKSHKEQAVIDGVPQYEYLTLPKLSNAPVMFSGCRLDKPTTLSILNSLKTYTSGSHLLTIGIHQDLLFDKDINTALKKVCLNYVTNPEMYGVEFTEEVTNDKKWTLTIGWNGTYTENATPQPAYNNLDVELPDGYQLCNYLEDDGTQWIETNYVPGNETGLYVVAKQTTYNDGYPMGSGSDTKGICAPKVLTNSVSGFCFSGYLSNATRNVFNNRYYYGFTNWLNSRKGEWRIGPYYSSGAVNNLSFTPTNSIHIFRSNMSGLSGWGSRLWKGRVYRAKISEGTEIIRDFVPCLNPSGKPCMYDIINGTEYINQGTGADFAYELYEA